MRDRGIKERQMRRQTINRIIFYITGLLILAMGLTLNTKAGLGVSPIISVSYSISQITGMNFGNTTMGLYCVFVVVELILHFIRDRRSEKTEGAVLEHANRMNRKLVFLMDVTDPAEYDIYPVFKSFCKSYPGFFRRRGRRKAVCSPVCSADPCIDPDGDRSGYVIEYEDHSKPGRRDCADDRRLYS